MTEIYIARVSALEAEAVFAAGLRLVPPERRQQVLRCRGRADRMRGLGAGLLLEYGLRQRGYSLILPGAGKTTVRLAYGRYGKPFLAGAEGLYFNLSHAGIYAAAVFSDREVGVDVERIREGEERRERIARRFFHPDEYAYLESCPPADRGRVFTELWTKKESYIKAVGEGMHLPLPDFSVCGGLASDGEEFVFRTSGLPQGYVLSVCGQGAAEAVFTEVGLAGLCAEAEQTEGGPAELCAEAGEEQERAAARDGRKDWREHVR